MTKDLTVGKVPSLLVRFTIPLVLGNLFQLTYNAADSIIVGLFVGKDALAAVGTCNPLMTLIILFLNGLCMGAGVLMGIQYGSGQHSVLKRQISTTMLFGIAFSILITIIGHFFARPILLLIQVDASILSVATGYMRIIFYGLTFTFLYNFYTSTLRALGDSTTPLYFLIVSAVLNILGDLFFVIILHMGSNGCALATVISEALCCLFCGLYIKRKVPILCLGKNWLVFDKSLLLKTVSYGWASAMQQATVQLGKIGIQTIVNTMGVSATAAFSAVNRIDDYAYTPQQNIGHGMTSLMAQNYGAGKKERMKEGFRFGMILELIYGILISLVCFLFARPLMTLFTKDEIVIQLGVTYLRLMSFMYILPAITNGLQGYFRGIGDLKITLLSSFMNMGVRVLAAIPLVFVFHFNMEALPFSYLAGWFAMLICELPLLIKNYKHLHN